MKQGIRPLTRHTRVSVSGSVVLQLRVLLFFPVTGRARYWDHLHSEIKRRTADTMWGLFMLHCNESILLLMLENPCFIACIGPGRR
ncbi:hypothetical protein LZ30DRAFT_36984 [Colletotrichum cereale]|nr:hypothetical protein LZ30DRAFT_36984 [Colletotrichum cereale]